MTDMRLVVVGAAGRMGQMLVRTIHETPGVVLSGALERTDSPALGKDAGELAGCGKLGVFISDDKLETLAMTDGVIDFSSPAATLEIAAIAAQARIVHVIGTTGMSADDLKKLYAAARHAVVVRSGNMSLGVNLLAALVEKVARALGADWDVEIVEMHHRMKVDAPSGTALMLGEAAAKGRDIALAEHSVRARDGITGARRSGDIGFAALRGGTVVGDHSVIFAGAGERVELTHKAEDRGIFARGALKAALWGRGKKPGLYSMADVLGINESAAEDRTTIKEPIMSERLLVLVRHGQSDWNLKNLFTGWKDPDLTPKGVEEAHAAGQRLKAQGLGFDIAFTSVLTRAQNTLRIVLDELGTPDLKTLKDQALNERDYGDLSGLNKDDARKKWGEEQVHIWRRSYDVAPPGGESLKDTVARVLPYYNQEILPAVLRGERTIVAAHGNSLRALVMVLDRLTPKTIPSMELDTGVPLVYRLKADSTVELKLILTA